MFKWIRKLFNRGCIDYSKPYIDSPIRPIDDGYYIDNRKSSKPFKIGRNSHGDKYKIFDNNTTEAFSDWNNIQSWLGVTATHILWPGTSNIGYHNSKL